LTLTQSAPTPAPPAPVPVETVDRQKLEALTRPKEPASAAPAQAPEEKKAADLEQANEKLSSFLGKPK